MTRNETEEQHESNDEHTDLADRAPIVRFAARLPGFDVESGWTPRNVIATAIYTAIGVPVGAFLTLLVLVMVLAASGQMAAGDDLANDPGATTLSESEAAAASTPVATPTTTPSASVSDHDAIERELSEQMAVAGHPDAIVKAPVDDPDVGVIYESAQTTPDGMAVEMGTIMGAYVNTITAGHDPGSMVVTVVDANSDEIAGSYIVEREWADAYIAGTMSGEEFAERVFGTIVTY